MQFFSDGRAPGILHIHIEAAARLAGLEAEAKNRADLTRRENEDRVLRVEAAFTDAKDRADRAEQWLVLIRREIEQGLMPSIRAMRDGPKPTNSAARPRSVTISSPSRFRESWFQRLWRQLSAMAATPGCLGTDFTAFEPGLASALSYRKTANTAPPRANHARRREPAEMQVEGRLT